VYSEGIVQASIMRLNCRQLEQSVVIYVNKQQNVDSLVDPGLTGCYHPI